MRIICQKRQGQHGLKPILLLPTLVLCTTRSRRESRVSALFRECTDRRDRRFARAYPPRRRHKSSSRTIEPRELLPSAGAGCPVASSRDNGRSCRQRRCCGSNTQCPHISPVRLPPPLLREEIIQTRRGKVKPSPRRDRLVRTAGQNAPRRKTRAKDCPCLCRESILRPYVGRGKNVKPDASPVDKGVVRFV